MSVTRIQNKVRRMFRSPLAISPASLSTNHPNTSRQASSSPRRLASRIAVNQYTTRPWSFEQDLACYQDAKVPAIGLTVEKIDQFGRDRAVQLFQNASIAGSSLNWIAGLTGANGYSLDEALDEGVETLRLAHELGIDTVAVIAGPRNDHTWSHAQHLVCDALCELSDYASRLGVHLALMPMGRQYRANWSFIRSLREALSLVQAVERQNVGLLLNTAHVFRERGLPNLLAEAAEFVRLVRLCDCSGRPRHENDQRWLGEGNVPVNAIAAVLDDRGYGGYYEIDVWSQKLWQSCDFQSLLRSVKDLTFGSPPPPAPQLT